MLFDNNIVILKNIIKNGLEIVKDLVIHKILNKKHIQFVNKLVNGHPVYTLNLPP